ncbi:MAG: energy-coupling factor transporter ATPase [Firmicutes bacterium]|nr:energy-coupling factor transporter ATPase [Bacillota bacterium]
MENIIKVQDVTFEYRRTGNETSAILALDDISLDIEKGSFTAIIGVNGSGKSTLAKNMNGLMLPTGGKVYVKGMDTTDSSQIWDIRQTVGMVFQNPDNQMVSAVVEDDIAFGPENLGVEPEEIRRRVDMSLQAVGMYDFRKKAPHMLSGGQKQRIAIAGVVAMLPECIVFDEPTAMLDPQGRREVLDIIEKLNKESGKTIVLITHFMDEVANADRIVVMDGGKIVMDGKPQDIFVRNDELKGLGLDVPFAAELACRLRQRGIYIPENIILMDELADHIKENC